MLVSGLCCLGYLTPESWKIQSKHRPTSSMCLGVGLAVVLVLISTLWVLFVDGEGTWIPCDNSTA